MTQALKQNEEKIKLFAKKLPTPKLTTLVCIHIARRYLYRALRRNLILNIRLKLLNSAS